jgi:hypothetical protein
LIRTATILSVLVLGIGAFLFYRMATTDARLGRETDSVSMSLDFRLISTQRLYGNLCMADTCPTIVQKYEVDATREAVRQVLLKRLRSARYTIIDDAAGDISAKRDGFYLWTSLSPKLGTGARDYAKDLGQQTQHVDALDISIQLNN